MKIGILTFHRSINNGAVIQCYSLCKRIHEDFPDVVVEVIDYDMPKTKVLYPTSLTQYIKGGNTKQKIKKLLDLINEPSKISRIREKKRIFEDALTNLNLSTTHIYDDGIYELEKYLNENYDIVVVGSDAVWNFKVRGYPNPYYLSNRVKPIRMSYAASCFSMNYEDIEEKRRSEIKEILEGYRFLGVRDDETGLFLESIGCKHDYVHTCDPTVFLDVNKLPVNEHDLRKKLSKKGFDFNKKTIAVMGDEKMARFVRTMYGVDYQIVSLFNYTKAADINLYDLNPYEWAFSFRFYNLTFTTYFHGTLLSLRNGTPVICLALDTEFTRRHKSKVEDFLQRIQMEKCYFHTDYINLNREEIRIMANDLLENPGAEEIIRRMDLEAMSYSAFHECLRKFIS